MKNIIERSSMSLLAFAAVFASTLIITPVVAAKEQTINAFATYDSEGKIYLTGENKGTFVGAIVGQFFVESETGPLHAGRIVCPAMLQLDLKSGKQSGSGQCTIIAKDGAKIFAVWSCRGVQMVGCDGTLMLIGGTGRTANASGSGPLMVKSISPHLLKVSSDSASIATLGRGLFVLRGFKYRTPDK